tara:strand:- start:2026 stop:3012 length:987 start_codon:yes stop_codon:yes gene_type:complete
MSKCSDLFIGKRLQVGDAVNPNGPLFMGVGPTEIRGTGYVEGPFLAGDDTKFPGPEASLMVGRCTNTDAAAVIPGLMRIRNLVPGTETPQDVIFGDPSGPVGITFYCGLSFFSVEAAAINFLIVKKNEVASVVTEAEAIKTDVGAKLFAGAKTEMGVDSNLAAAFNSAPLSGSTYANYVDFNSGATTLNTTFGIAISKKSFDIPHPTKENHRLRYVCLEGPGAEVYVRGKLKGDNIIHLPEYWKGLVDPESITVQLTPIGCRQSLFYEEVEWCSTIKVINADCGPVWCSYTVFAERNDVEKNIPVYEGTTPADYPGDNSNYVINGGNK